MNSKIIVATMGLFCSSICIAAPIALNPNPTPSVGHFHVTRIYSSIDNVCEKIGITNKLAKHIHFKLLLPQNSQVDTMPQLISIRGARLSTIPPFQALGIYKEQAYMTQYAVPIVIPGDKLCSSTKPCMMDYLSIRRPVSNGSDATSKRYDGSIAIQASNAALPPLTYSCGLWVQQK